LLGQAPFRLAIIASSLQELDKKLSKALKRLTDPQCIRIKNRDGIYFFENPLGRTGKLAFIFPGEGSQYVNMLSDLCIHFPEIRKRFDQMNEVFSGHSRDYVPSDFIFPRPAFLETERKAVEERLWEMDVAIEAVLSANSALFDLLSHLEIRPDVVLGHSTGEYSSMRAAGILDIIDSPDHGQYLLQLNQRHEELATEKGIPHALLIAVGADFAQVASIIDQINGELYIAMDNCPHQTVIAGSDVDIKRAIDELKCQGIIYQILPFKRPYHTPLFKAYADMLYQFYALWPMVSPGIPIYSCTTNNLFPNDIEKIRKIAVEHWIRPVKFRQTIEKMYADGVRIFVEVGPKGNLTAFVNDILNGRDHTAVATNISRRSGITQLHHVLGLLAAQGVSMQLDYLYSRREPRKLMLDGLMDSHHKKGETSGSMILSLQFPRLQLKKDKMAKTPSVSEASVEQNVYEQGLSNVSEIPSPTPHARGESIIHSPSEPRSQVMQEYFRTMEHFLEIEHELMDSFLKGHDISSTVASTPAQNTKQCTVNATVCETIDVTEPEADKFTQPLSVPPLLGDIISFTPEMELVTQREISLDEDLFLQHHTIGRRVSVNEEGINALPVMPLTMSMEILAEAGSVLMPGKVLIGMKDILAYRWIALEQKSLSLRISARRKPGTNEVETRIQNFEEKRVSSNDPVVEGTLVFANNYPHPPSVNPIVLQDERPSRWTPEELYSKGMFHGPCWQGVASVDRWGKDGSIAVLEVLPNDGFLRSIKTPKFMTDPIVLDAAGQVVGFWTMEHLERGFLVFPYRIKALHIYHSQPPVNQKVKCQARIKLLGSQRVSSDIDIVNENGRLWMRLEAWEDKRFDLPPSIQQFLLSPIKVIPSIRWDAPIASWRNSSSFYCCRIDKLFRGDEAFWKRVFANLLLNQKERQFFSNLGKSEERQIQWLMGRMVAKDAVRTFLKQNYGMEMGPADVEIGQDQYGRPVPQGTWVKEIETVPALSLAHSKGIAVAVVGHSHGGRRLGIDVERVDSRKEMIEQMMFSPEEFNLLKSTLTSEDTEWSLRIWCAKEAVGKAIGRGLLGRPKDLILRKLDPAIGTVSIEISGIFAREFPRLGGELFQAQTLREGDLVVASTMNPIGGSYDK
jgi:malonyl CoA-acyl carrier protein transacylase/phosphopantetheinyl transferase